MPDRHGRDQRGYRRKAARLKRQGGDCWICKQPIDPTLDWRHPMAFTADHVQPLSQGGDLYGETRPAHRSCNSSRGDGTRPTRQPLKTSRDW